MNKNKLIQIVGIILLLALIFWSPFTRVTGDFSKILNNWGRHQQETSEVITDKAVSGAEGALVGEHEVDGSNWSIPNIIRNLLGVND